MLLTAINIILIIGNNDKKEIQKDIKTYESNKKHFAMFVENEESTNYTEYTSSNIFPIGYVLNNDKSSCVGTNGQEIEGILSSSENGVTVTSNKTAYCYLYFDRPSLYELCGPGESIDECSKEKDLGIVKTMWDSTLEDDGYRFVGTNPDNYICFGTTDQEECKNNTDKYMYRIIGVFEDSEGQQHLKLIKKEALNTAYAWHSDSSTDTDWDESDLYKGINGSYFATNADYSYMQDSTWTDNIEEWTYTFTNTETYSASGPDYFDSLSPSNIYSHEMNRSTNAFPSTVNTYTETTEKISLMYVSDYVLSLGKISTTISTGTNANATTLKTGWMHISNNDTTLLSTWEWTSSRFGSGSDGYFDAWFMRSFGNVFYNIVNARGSVRPVFYLTAATQLSGGTGASTDPYTIKPAEQTDTEKLIENVSSNVLWNSSLEDDGYRYVGTNPDNYVCFGYSNATTDCDFTNATNTDLYAYRIIGIFADNEGTPHIKLIKKEALNTAYAWNADYKTDTDWDASDLFKGLNESYFLTNTTYVPAGWSDKIAEWKYTATNTKTYESSGPDYYNSVTVQNIYLHEMNRSSKTCTIGEWKPVSAKIGLMYVSDYLLSLGSSALGYKSYDNRTTLKTGWMHISNNDSDAYQYEWTISRYGGGGGWFSAWSVSSNGRVSYDGVVNAASVRPVFYLTSDVKISGEGTKGSPYIIS